MRLAGRRPRTGGRHERLHPHGRLFSGISASDGTSGPARLDRVEGWRMSAGFAIALALVTFGSMYACYQVGWREGRRVERQKQEGFIEFLGASPDEETPGE